MSGKGGTGGDVASRKGGSLRGRYGSRVADVVCEALSSGLSVAASARAAGITEKSYYLWRRVHPEFLKATEAAKEAGRELVRDRLEAALLDRALGGTKSEKRVTTPDGGAYVTEMTRQESSLLVRALQRYDPSYRDEKAAPSVTVISMDDVLDRLDARKRGVLRDAG